MLLTSLGLNLCRETRLTLAGPQPSPLSPLETRSRRVSMVKEDDDDEVELTDEEAAWLEGKQRREQEELRRKHEVEKQQLKQVPHHTPLF